MCRSRIFVIIFSLVFAFSKASTWERSVALDTFISNPNKSMAVSILPLRLSLCKLTTIANGKTRAQLVNALKEFKYDPQTNSGFASIFEMLDDFKHTDLTMLNKVYINYSKEVDTRFLTKSNGVEVEFVGFDLPRSASTFINNGIASATFRRIKDIIELKDITDETNMMLITAAHLKTTWEIPFDVRQTYNRKFFHLTDKISEIPMMVRADSYELYDNGNYQVLTTKLQSQGAAMTLVVPSQTTGLPGLLQELKNNPNLMKNARAAMKLQMRKLVMPRFKIKSVVDLTENFRKTELNEILNSNSSGLNGFLKQEFRSNRSSNMFISKIKQKLFLDVDELGVSRDIMSAYEQNLVGQHHQMLRSMREVAADRPFFFTFDLEEFHPAKGKMSFLPHQLFCGVYYGPE